MIFSFTSTLIFFAYAVSLSAASNSTSSLTWKPCSSELPSSLTCSELEVPINWDEPNGEKVTLFISRLAANPKKRIGNLLLNPGGPGLSPFFLFDLFLQANVTLFPGEFDIIGPDPRGIGQSHPLQCDPKLFNEHQQVSLQPTTQARFEKLLKSNAALGESCRNLTGPLLGYMDSESVAKDFEAIRIALGDDKITYLGISYGTVIGQAYASLFPDTIRAMALDGNLDHSLSESSSLSGEVNTYENVFTIFVQWCAKTRSCPLHGQDVATIFTDLVDKADKTPIPAPGCELSSCLPTVTGEQIRFNLQGLLVFKEPNALVPGWDEAALALKQASEGNATLLSSTSANQSLDMNIWSSGIATLCLDWNHTSHNVSQLIYKKMLGHALAPYTRGASEAWTQQTACIGWPEPVRYQGHLLDIPNGGPVFLTNAYHDTETPYVWANGLLAQFQNAVLATRNGDGHTSYFLGSSSETHNAINEFLVSAHLPPPNTVYQT